MGLTKIKVIKVPLCTEFLTTLFNKIRALSNVIFNLYRSMSICGALYQLTTIETLVLAYRCTVGSERVKLFGKIYIFTNESEF